MKHKTRENIIIYGSLLMAILLVCYVTKTYYDNRDNNEEVFSELEEVFTKNVEDNIGGDEIVESEPNRIKDVDKITVINNYMEDILNRRIKDELLTYEMVYTWGEFGVEDINYVRKIADNYYSYNVYFKISNKDANIVGSIDNEKSNDEYKVIKLIFNFVIEGENVIIKNVME